jgi:N-formylmaleamate deformylase
MDRRSFLAQSAAFAMLAAAPSSGFAQGRFRPSRFSVQVRGRGPDVIMIPGLTMGRDVWDQAVRGVGGYRYHLVTVAGFAGEPARGNAAGPVVAPIAAEIARYIQSAGLRRPAIVGHSMGGMIAMMLAARHPDRVGKVMVIDILPRPTSMFGGSGAANLAESLSGIIGTTFGRRVLSDLLSAFTPPVVRNRNSDPDVVARAMQELGTVDLSGELRNIRAPMTVLYAVPNRDGRDLTDRAFANGFRGARTARLVRVEPSGHYIMGDQPDRFANELRTFLRR